MPERLISADKVEEWLRWFVKRPENVHSEFLSEYEAGTFDPTPPVQPDTKEVIIDEPNT